jgi:radical SAM-linked protein
VWERALRRADLPIAYSEGFTPHAKVSFPDALPVGNESTGEYAELTFAAPIDPEVDLARLSRTLPEGMDVTTYLEVPDGAPKLARMLRATLWELVWPAVDAAELTDLLDRRGASLLTAERVEVIRHRPKGDRTIDVRPAVLAMAAASRAAAPHDGGGQRTVLRAVLRNDGPTVRPTDLLSALGGAGGCTPADGAPRRSTSPGHSASCAWPRARRSTSGLREALTGEVETLVARHRCGGRLTTSEPPK